MAQKTKVYRDVKFAPEVIQAAFAVYDRLMPDGRRFWQRHVGVTEYERWDLDTDAEFFAKYRGDIVSAGYRVDGFSLTLREYSSWLQTDVSVASTEISQIETVFNVFEDRIEESRVPRVTVPPRVFIGHGHDDQWKDLRDDLRDHHDLDVFSFETGVHAGESIAEALDEMASTAGFALLVHTAEDETADAELRARQNVIHETGLFQGTLGRTRAIVVREQRCEGFSNIDGIQELRFERGHIREVTGDVLAAIEREFPAR